MDGSCYQKLRSYYQITARPCHPEEEEQQQQKEGGMRFFENIFLWIFLISGLVIVHTASLLVQEHRKSNLWRNLV